MRFDIKSRRIELSAQEVGLLRREAGLAGHLVAPGHRVAPRLIGGLGPCEELAVTAKQIEQLELAAFLEQPARLGRAVEIDPVLTQPLERGERREAAVHGDLRGLLPRKAAPE